MYDPKYLDILQYLEYIYIHFWIKIYDIFCIPITFNNALDVCFSNKKYPITIKTRQTQIVKVYFLLKNQFLTDF